MPLSLEPPQQGSALLATLAIVIIVGIMTALGIGVFETETSVDRSFETRRKMVRVANALASYTHNRFRLPCPAILASNPHLASSGLENSAGEVCNSPYDGVVPYRTLNLSYEDVLDAWGRPIAYAVSPVFAETDPAQPGNSVAGFCRTDGTSDGPPSRDKWVIDAAVTGSNHQNINPRKALFCCPSTDRSDVNKDLRLVHTDGRVLDPSPYNNFAIASTFPVDPVRTNIPEDFAAPDIEDASPPGPSVRSPETFAFVLLSRGNNGSTGDASPLESGNADTASANIDLSRSFTDGPRNLIKGDHYFDDILIYMTQNQLMAKLNNGTCRTPYFSYQHN